MNDSLFQYAVSIRRELHRHPETGFDLPRTTAVVKRELEALQIPYTEQYGTCSIVAALGNDPEKKTLGLRADMDALPIAEQTGLPYRSEIPGKMHACGHDAHTAVLLAVARSLKEREKELPYNIRFLFQPSEECADSGAKMMVDNHVTEGIDAILCTHCDNELHTGIIGIHPGDYMAACIPMEITFHGKTAHATLPDQGADAIAMAADAYGRLKKMVQMETSGNTPYIWSTGAFHGGTAHNVIADLCRLDISFRFYDTSFAHRVMARAEAICQESASRFGGTAQLNWHISTPAVHNDEALSRRFAEILRQDSNLSLLPLTPRMSSEDFGWYLTKTPGILFRFGTRSEAQGCTSLAHCSDFRIDENGMRSAIQAFLRCAMDPAFL